MGPKKKLPKAAAAPAPGAVTAPVAGAVEARSASAFTPAEAKKLAKLLKASDRGKRLDAIRVVSENHGYIASGGCLLPLLESTVIKKKMEEVVSVAAQVIVDYLVGRDVGVDPALPTDAALAVLQEAKKKPAKYKLAEVLANLVLSPDRGNSWNAVRSLRSLAAAVQSLPKDSPQAASLGAMLLRPGQPVERLCGYLVAQEAEHANSGSDTETNNEGATVGNAYGAPWAVVRLYVMDTIGVMCGISNEAIQTVVSTGTVRCVLGVLRSVTKSETPDMSLLTSTLVVLFAVAKAGAGATAPAAGGGVAEDSKTRDLGLLSGDVALGGGGTSGVSTVSPELVVLAEGGAWGAVYDALKGPCMARATELQQSTAAAVGKKGGGDAAVAAAAAAAAADLTACVDNMARCAEVLRVMAMTGAGIEEEGALEAGVAAMSSVLGMEGLPRDQAAVANLMIGMVKAMGSIACLSESNRVKVCSAGAAPRVLALMAPPDDPASRGSSAAAGTVATGGSSSPLDTPHGRLMRKTAEKCLHHLVVSRVTWMADDRALCDTSATPPDEPGPSGNARPPSGDAAAAASGARVSNDETDAAAEGVGRRRSSGSGGGNRGGDRAAPEHPAPAPGPAYLAVDAVLAAANADSIDVRCRAVRLLSRLMSSPRCAAALGVSAVPTLGRLVGWWLRTKDDPEAHRTPRPEEPNSSEGGGGKSATGGGGGGGGGGVGGKKGPVGKAAAKDAAAAAAAAAAAEDAKGQKAAEDEAAAAAAVARVAAAKKLEESDSTRVLRDEALAYALTVMLKLAESGGEERAAIGEVSVVELLVSVLKMLPCTPEEFYANAGEKRRSMTGPGVAGVGGNAAPPISTTPALATAGKAGKKGLGSGDAPHAPSHAAGGGLLNPKLDTTLDLSLAQHRPGSGNTPRKLCCWRGEKSRDPEVPLFSPLDWGWDFQVGVSQAPIQPGLVLRAAALRVLLAVADGYDPAAEAIAAAGAASTAAATKGAAAAAAAADTSAKAAALSGGKGARSVLSRALPVCVDLLSVDVRHAREIGEAGGQPPIDKPTADDLSGWPVSPSEELVHEEIRVACLRLLGSLLRLGGVAREALLSVAASHRGGGFKHLEEHGGRSCTNADAQAPPSTKNSGTMGDRGTAAKNSGGGEVDGGVSPWVKPDYFRDWNLRGECDLNSIRASLPYARALSMFLLPLRNPDAPATDIVAALVAMKRLCREDEHEAGGTQPEAHPPSAEDDQIPHLPSCREGTAGALVDTLAGVAVGMGALVPLVSIWGCAVAAAGSAVDLAPGITGMVSECQDLINYLIRRGHAREDFWSSLPSLEQISEARAAAAEAATPRKAPRKSKGSSGKAGKGGGKGSRDPSTAALETEEEEMPDEPKPPDPPAGRPDPNMGPDRASWGQLLNARVDEQRTQTRGTTALLMATVTGLETAVSNLLLAGADPNVRGCDGRTPLMCALAQGMDEAARGLVEAGADVDAVNLEGDSVLRCSFLCPARRTMRRVMRKRPETREDGATPASAGSGRRGPTTPIDGGFNGGQVGRRQSSSSHGMSRSGSRSRSRSRSGSLTRDRRRSSLSRSISFGEEVLVGDTAVAAASGTTGGAHGRRLSRMASLSALDSAREALRESAPRESARPLKTPRGTTVVPGDARMVPYILECGADPNVSSGSGDFPLHWAVTGAELTVRIMNQKVKIVAAGGGGGSGDCGGETTQVVAPKETAMSGEDGTGDIAKPSTGTETARDGHQGDLALLEVLIRAGSALDACNPEGMTALHAAVIAGRESLAETLLDAGASPNVSDSLGCLPLHYACLRATAGYADLASRLLALGMGRPFNAGVYRDLRKGKTRREKLLLDVADIMHKGLCEATEPSCITQHRATRSELLNFVTAEGFTPIHYVCDGRVAGRHAAATVLAVWREREHASASPEVLLNGNGNGNGVGDAGSTHTGREGPVLPEDGSVDRVKILTWLLSEPELDPRVRLRQGATTLHMAARVPGSQGADLVRSLIQRRAVNLDALDSPAATACSGRSAGEVASVRGSANFGCDDAPGGATSEEQESVPQARFSALHYALQARSWESASLLLSAGASVGAEVAYPPCLHVACLAGAPAPLVERLLEGDKRLPNINALCAEAGLYGATPLFLAAAAGSVDLVCLLLSADAKRDPLCPGSVQMLDDIAEDKTVAEVHNAADRAGPVAPVNRASESVWTMEHRPSDGRNPLHAAAAGGHTDAASALLDAESAAAAAAAAGGEGLTHRSWLNTPDVMGNTPLHVAICEGHWECAERLAAAERFDIRLGVDGASSSLIIAERANMSIVDEGSGDPRTLSALRESNKLVMTLLKRLHDATVGIPVSPDEEEVGREAKGACDETGVSNDTTAADGPVVRLAAQSNADGGAPPPVDGANGIEDEAQQPTIPAAASTAALAAGSPVQRSSSAVPVVHHLHPCFGEGVLYSNAKGIFVPDTPERRSRRKSFRPRGAEDKDRAAVIIQSRARQAGARRAVAERRRGGGAKSKKRRRSSGVRRSWSEVTEEEKAAVVIQARARQARAKSETTRRRELQRQQQRERRGSKRGGEVGEVVVTRIQTQQQRAG